MTDIDSFYLQDELKGQKTWWGPISLSSLDLPQTKQLGANLFKFISEIVQSDQTVCD